MEIINFENKKMIPLNIKSKNHISIKNTVTSVKKSLKTNMLMIKNILKLKITVIMHTNTEVLHVVYVI